MRRSGAVIAAATPRDRATGRGLSAALRDIAAFGRRALQPRWRRPAGSPGRTSASVVLRNPDRQPDRCAVPQAASFGLELFLQLHDKLLLPPFGIKPHAGGPLLGRCSSMRAARCLASRHHHEQGLSDKLPGRSTPLCELTIAAGDDEVPGELAGNPPRCIARHPGKHHQPCAPCARAAASRPVPPRSDRSPARRPA